MIRIVRLPKPDNTKLINIESKDAIIVPAEDNNQKRVIPLEVGVKIECRDFILEKLKNELMFKKTLNLILED
jgi:hypothetical protein